MEFSFGKKYEKISISNSDGVKAEYKSKMSEKEQELEEKLIHKLKLNAYVLELSTKVKFDSELTKAFILKVLVSQILEGYKSIRDFKELLDISVDILNKIFEILKNNNKLEPEMLDFLKIIDNMKINSIQKDAQYYYETEYTKRRQIKDK